MLVEVGSWAPALRHGPCCAVIAGAWGSEGGGIHVVVCSQAWQMPCWCGVPVEVTWTRCGR